MATAAKEADVNGEVKPIDTEQAFKIFDSEIAPKNAKLAEIKGNMSEPWDRIKECNFPKKIMTFIDYLSNLEESKCDHFLHALHLGLEHRKLRRMPNLVDMAEGKAASEPVVPAEEKKKPVLHTVS